MAPAARPPPFHTHITTPHLYAQHGWAQAQAQAHPPAHLAARRRVYNRGSGERHHVALPSYPHFEGRPLAEVDEVEEGELSALGRHAALREDDAMYADFQEKLLFNLGLVRGAGTGLRGEIGERRR
jgi:hypothetical protein